MDHQQKHLHCHLCSLIQATLLLTKDVYKHKDNVNDEGNNLEYKTGLLGKIVDGKMDRLLAMTLISISYHVFHPGSSKDYEYQYNTWIKEEV